MKIFVLLVGCLLAINVVAADAEKPAKFEIRAVVDETSTNAEQMVFAQTASTGQVSQERLYIDKTVLVNNSSLNKATIQSNPVSGAPEVAITFSKAGTKRLAEVTREHVGKRVAILINGRIFMAPVIAGEISGGKIVLSSASLTQDQAAWLAGKLNLRSR